MKNKLPITLLLSIFSFLPISNAIAEGLWGDLKELGKEVAEETKETGKEVKEEVDGTNLEEVADDTKQESKQVVEDARKEIKRK